MALRSPQVVLSCLSHDAGHVGKVSVVENVVGMQVSVMLLSLKQAHLQHTIELHPWGAFTACHRVEIEVGGSLTDYALCPIEVGLCLGAVKQDSTVEGNSADEIPTGQQIAVEQTNRSLTSAASILGIKLEPSWAFLVLVCLKVVEVGQVALKAVGSI